MKKIVSPLLCCAVMALSAATGQAQSRLLRVADPVSPCQDSMETVPAIDSLEPVLIETADVSCKVPPTPISA